MRRHESYLVLRMWPAASPARRLVREHLLDEESVRRHVEAPQEAPPDHRPPTQEETSPHAQAHPPRAPE